MPIEQRAKVIGSTEYRVTQLAFRDQRKTFVLLANTLGPSVAGLLRQLSDQARNPDTAKGARAFFEAAGNLDVAVVGSVIGDFLAGLSDADLEALTTTFGDHTEFRPEGSRNFLPLGKDDRELQFAGSGFADFFPWLWFCIEVNYSGFFGVLSRLKGPGPKP